MGEVFSAGSGNGIDGKCTGPEEVPECRDYYEDQDLDPRLLARNKVTTTTPTPT